MLRLLLAVASVADEPSRPSFDAGQIISIILGCAMVGLLIGILAQVLLRNKPAGGTMSTLVLAPIGAIAGGVIGYWFDMGSGSVPLVLGGPVVLMLLYGVAKWKR
jgi:uncharacterized membrane protein YeaQ/YmgE (transglycosylase-associated protein family)